jgi:hypothetical protein
MNRLTRNLLAVAVFTFVASHTSFAGPIPDRPPCFFCWGDPHAVPEIDPAMGAGALALIGGAIMVIRGRSRKRD